MNRFLKIIRITVKNISCNMVHNIIIAVFVVIAIFFMNISLASYRYSHYLNEFAKTSGLYDSFMYAGQPNKHAYSEYLESTGENLDEKAMAYVGDELKHLKTDGVIADYSKCFRSGNLLDGNTNADFLYIKPEILKELSMPVAEGEWFDACPLDYKKKGLVPVVIGNHLKSIYGPGDIFTDASGDTQYIVIGILGRGTRFPGMSAGGSGMDLNTVMWIADDMVIVAEEPMERYGSFIIRFPEQNQTASEQEVLEKVADITDAFSFRYLADRAHEDNSYGIQMQTTLAVLALLICIAGTACGNLLSAARGEKRQAVYFLCGMKPKTSVVCMALENLVKLYLPAGIGLYVFYTFCKKQEYQDLYPGACNIWITCLIITVIFAASVVHPLSTVLKNKELNVIHS